MANSEGRVAIIGPGRSFGRELVSVARDKGLDPLVVSRMPGNYGVKGLDFDIATLNDMPSFASSLLQRGVKSIIFGARWRDVGNETAPERVQRHMQVGLLPLVGLFEVVRRSIDAQSFTVVGSDLGLVPDPQHLELSAMLSARMSVASSLGMRQAVIKGQATRDNAPSIAAAIYGVHTSDDNPQRMLVTIDGQ